MNSCINLFKFLFFYLLTSKYKIFTTFIYVPFLYLTSWIIIQPLRITNINKEYLSNIIEILTIILFFILISKWFHTRWGIRKGWYLIGIKTNNKKVKSITYFLKGVLQGSILVTLIIMPILINDWYEWQNRLSIFAVLNAILLSLTYGLGEEIFFRGWLQEELKIQLGIKLAVIIQSLIFSLVHGFQNIGLTIGLFLLGILLSTNKIKDKGSIWGCVGIHGGLVGIWFLITSMLSINENAPSWIVGLDKTNINPLGGFYGIILMIGLITFINNSRLDNSN